MKFALTFFLSLGLLSSFAQEEKSIPKIIPGINFSWKNQPLKWEHKNNSLKIMAGETTDLFIDPQDAYRFHNAPMLLFAPSDSFLLSAKLSVQFKTDYDAAALVLFVDSGSWAKFAFEFSPQKKATIVSVVNNGISDDCNHVEIARPNVFIRIAGLGNRRFAFHYSIDGKKWNLVRYFYLQAEGIIHAGFLSQSPTGKSCMSSFSSINYSIKRLVDIRSGQ